MQCEYKFVGVCFNSVTTTTSIFSFKDFITGLALLVIIYTISDIRYRFRLSIAPTPIYKTSYILISFIGIGTLLTDIWIKENWLVPESLITATIWQGILAILLLTLVLTWMFYAFIKPPVYGKNNYKKYADELYRIVLKGSEIELPIIAHELALSANSLVTFASALNKKKRQTDAKLGPCPEGYANDLLLLIANRRFCRFVVASSPITAIRLLSITSDLKAYNIPIGLFAQNVSTEAIQNKDSSLYHEDEGFYSGLLGYLKPLSKALYGNYELVSSLSHNSPLDIYYKNIWSWDADQFQIYCNAVLMTFDNYLEERRWRQDSPVLNRAIDEVQKSASRAIDDMAKLGDEYYGDAWHRLSHGTRTIRNLVDKINKVQPIPKARKLRIRKSERYSLYSDIYDTLAEAMFGIIHSAAYINDPTFKTWSIQHNSVWSEFFSFAGEGEAWDIVHFKLRRLIYEEITRLKTFANYKSARILGICLNVMGLVPHPKPAMKRSETALHRAVLSFTKNNYLNLRKENDEIADACIIGGISYDSENSQLVKTYEKGLNKEPDREYLRL